MPRRRYSDWGCVLRKDGSWLHKHLPPLQSPRNNKLHKFSLADILTFVRSCDVEAISGSLKRLDSILADLLPVPVQISLYSLLILLFLFSNLRLTQIILHWEGTGGFCIFMMSVSRPRFFHRGETLGLVGGTQSSIQIPTDSLCHRVCALSFCLLLCAAWPSIMASCRFSAQQLWLLRRQHFPSPWNPLTPFLFLKTSPGPTASMMCSH